MALIKGTLLGICCLCCAGLSFSQSMLPGQWGVEPGAPGPALKYPVISLGIWVAVKERTRASLEGGYFATHQPPLSGDLNLLYRHSTERHYIMAQYFYVIDKGIYHEWFIGTGPYWMQARATLGKGFVYNLPPGALTAFSGARFALSRVGLVTTTGVAIRMAKMTFGARLHFPVYYAQTAFTNLQKPLTVVNYTPATIRSYQEQVSRIQASWGLTLHFGYAFGCSKEAHRGHAR